MIFARATNNRKKLREIDRILSGLGHSVKSLSRLGVSVSWEETGDTFRENAVIKARRVAKATHLPTISDDSGICVDRLGGQPGVRTARYAGEGATDGENIDKLLSRLQAVPLQDRGAAFVSCVCLCVPVNEGEDRIITCEGQTRGFISLERIGEDGFGYDPVFICGGVSFAQMSREEKDAVSHRGKALRALGEKIASMDFESLQWQGQ